jgi:hypothetical protein
MRAVRCVAASGLVALLFASAAIAKDIHVNNLDGDDRFTGRQTQNLPDMSGPVRSIARALRLASQGDRIVLANTGEPYREGIALSGTRHSGYSFRPFVIEGNGAILDGSAPVAPETWENYQGPIFRFAPPRLTHQQLFLDDRPLVRVAASRQADGPPDLAALQWCLYDGHIYFSIEPDTTKLPQDYALTYARTRVGITLFHVNRVVIRDLTVQGYQLDGVNAFNSAREVTLTGVTSRGNGRNGITVGGASQVLINACLVGNNGSAQVLTLPYSETGIQNTELLSNTAPGWVDQGGRVYVEGERVEGGLEELVPGAQPAGPAAQ